MDQRFNFLELVVRWIFCAMSLAFGINFLIQAIDQHREIGIILFLILIVAAAVFIGMTIADTKKFLRGEDF